MKLFVCALTTLFVLTVAPLARAAAAAFSFTVGNAKITAIQDAAGEMPLSIFQGAPESEMKRFAPSGKTPAGVTVFLIRLGGRTMLVDTGYGSGKGELLSQLAAIGVTPAEIDMILLTHMHGDHIGGLVDNGVAVFPKAKIVVSAEELEYWMEKAAPEFAATAERARKVREAYGARLEAIGYAPVTPEISAVAFVGHTPGHTAFLLASKGEKMLFWGDTMHGAAIQFPMPEVCAKYDMDPKMAVESRKAALNMAVREAMPVAGAHLPFPALGRVARDGAGFRFLPGL